MVRHIPIDREPVRLEQYAELDIERLVVLPPSMSRHDEATTLSRLGELSAFMDAHRTASCRTLSDVEPVSPT